MAKKTFPWLAAGFLALWAVFYWFYDNLVFDAVIGWLDRNGTPEARLIANLPPVLVAAAIVAVLYYVVRHQVREEFAPPYSYDTSIADALNYVVNDAKIILRQPWVEKLETGPLRGQSVQVRGVEHMDALNRLEEQLASGRMKMWGFPERSPGNPMLVFTNSRREIPVTYWAGARLHPLNCFHATERIEQTILNPRTSAPLFTSLMVNRAQLTEAFPRKVFWKRWLDKVRKRPLKTYWKIQTERCAETGTADVGREVH